MSEIPTGSIGRNKASQSRNSFLQPRYDYFPWLPRKVHGCNPVPPLGDSKTKWWFSVLDIVGVLNEQDDYEKKTKLLEILKSKTKTREYSVG